MNTFADSGSFLVSPNVGLMIWTLVVFGLTMLLLWKVAFPRIGEALDKRQRAIEDSIDAAERTRREADELLAEYRERLAEARGQADEIVSRGPRAAGGARGPGGRGRPRPAGARQRRPGRKRPRTPAASARR